MRIAVINGPNLNLLGTREPAIYGRTTLAQIEERLVELAGTLGIDLDFHQSNHEGELIDILQRLRGSHGAAILNPGGLAHTSIALRDAVASIGLPVVDVHVTNSFFNETLTPESYTAGACKGVIVGMGPYGYELALLAAMNLAGTSAS